MAFNPDIKDDGPLRNSTWPRLAASIQREVISAGPVLNSFLIDDLDRGRSFDHRQAEPRRALGHSIERGHRYARQRQGRHLLVVRWRGRRRLGTRLPDG